MRGIIVSIDPVAFRLGVIEVRWYGVAIAAGIVAAVVVAIRQGRERGVSTADIYGLLPWLLLGGVLGARLVHVIDRWGYYLANPLQMVMFQQGGLAIWGAVFGGGLAAVFYSKRRHIPVMRLLDVATPALITGQIIGRLGCIANGDAWGSPADLPWSFIYINPAALLPGDLLGVPTHPYPVYEMLWNGAVLAALLRLRGRFHADGQIFLMYLVLYSIGRFGFSYVRQESPWWLGLQQAQALSLLILAAALGLLVFRAFKRPGNQARPSGRS